MAKLKELQFSDIYLGATASWLAGVPGKLDPVPAPAECNEELADLRRLCDDECRRHNRREITVRNGGVSYRVAVLVSLTETVYVLRRFPDRVERLDAIGIHASYAEKLMQTGLTGLIVIAGAFGQGKTSTASALIASRLAAYGGVAVTIEDPPEMPLEGRHGEGVCYQTWVVKGEFGDALRNAARWAPSIIFVGEVRDAETANEALRASINGRLVVCTTHADSVPMAVERLFSLARADSGNPEDIAHLLASGLRCVVHQELVGEPKRLKASMLWLGDETAAQGHIRRREWAQLQNTVDMQYNRLRVGMGRTTKAVAA